MGMRGDTHLYGTIHAEHEAVLQAGRHRDGVRSGRRWMGVGIVIHNSPNEEPDLSLKSEDQVSFFW